MSVHWQRSGLAYVSQCTLWCTSRRGKAANWTTPPDCELRARPFPSVYKATRRPLLPNIRSPLRHSFALTMWLLILAGECATLLFARTRTTFSGCFRKRNREMRARAEAEFLFITLSPVEDTLPSVHTCCWRRFTRVPSIRVWVLCQGDPPNLE